MGSRSVTHGMPKTFAILYAPIKWVMQNAPPQKPTIPVRTPTSPAPKLSLTKPIVTKELGKPATSTSVTHLLAAPMSEGISQTRDWSTSKSKALALTYDTGTTDAEEAAAIEVTAFSDADTDSPGNMNEITRGHSSCH